MMGSLGQDTVGAGTFWGVLNVSLRASGTRLGLGLTCFVIRHLSLTESVDFLSLTGDPNWPFRCLNKDKVCTVNTGRGKYLPCLKCWGGTGQTCTDIGWTEENWRRYWRQFFTQRQFCRWKYWRRGKIVQRNEGEPLDIRGSLNVLEDATRSLDKL